MFLEYLLGIKYQSIDIDLKQSIQNKDNTGKKDLLWVLRTEV